MTAAMRLRSLPRRLTAPLRPLPGAVLLGTMKGGTSSLYGYLKRHPDTLPANRKEVHFFDLNHFRGEGWYRAHFPVGLRGLAYEATPYYLFHPHAPRRMQAMLPDAKLLILLRNPVTRAWSHFRHEVRAGRELRSFAEALAAEPREVGVDAERLDMDPGGYARNHHRHAYLGRGRYVEQLERWFAVYPRSQFLVLKSEALFRETAATFERVVSFLDLAPWAPETFETRNVGGEKAALDPALRAQLERYFQPHNERLAALLGPEFSW